MSDKFRDELEQDAAPESVPGGGAVFGELPLPPARPIGNVLTVKGEGSFAYKRFLIMPTGLQLPSNMQKFEWEEVGQHIKSLDSSLAWVIGDWALAANKAWKMTYADIAKKFGYETSSVETYASICEAIPGLIRNQAASFAHHRQLVNLSDEMVVMLQKYIALHKLTVAGLKVEMAALNRVTEERRHEAVIWALEHRAKLSEQPELKADPVDPPPDVKQAAKYGGAINKALPNLHALDDKRRQQVAERADWLAQYYADIARRARGE